MIGDPSEKYRARIYRDYASSIEPTLRSAQTRESLSASDDAFERFHLHLLPTDKKAHIFDAGAGRGAFLDYLARKGYANALGVDRSPETVRRAKELGVRSLDLGDAGTHLAQHPAYYDCVIALDVLEHLRKDEVMDFLDAVFKALKPGGMLVVQTANADGPLFGRMMYADFTHETAFTRYSLYQAFGATGFTESEFHPLGPVGSGFRACLRRQLWKLIRLGVNLYYHVETGSGIFHNDHILTLDFLGKTRKPA